MRIYNLLYFLILNFNIFCLAFPLSNTVTNNAIPSACWSEKFGIPCCKTTVDVVSTTYDGKWGKENGMWCGLGTSSTRPANDIPPSPPPLTNLNQIVDPAGDCDISDSITGDSLAKAAPFRFGVGLNGNSIEYSTTSSKVMRELIKYQFNSVTYSNLMKPIHVLDQRASINNIRNGRQDPVLNFSNVVDGLDFCQKSGIHMRGHVLVWHTQTPTWFFKVGYEDGNNFVDAKTMEYRLDSYIKQYLDFVQHNYPGVVDVWDVVNEAVEINQGEYDKTTGWYTRTSLNKQPNPWYVTLGPDYVAKAFRSARKYALPNVTLVYNDFNTFQSPKREAIITLLKLLKKENLVDAVGMQSYLGLMWPNRSDYKKTIEMFSKVGVDVQITELTIDAPNGQNIYEEQADQYRIVFEYYMDLFNAGCRITSVTVFGLQDGYRFYSADNNKTRLFDRNLKKKPAYYAILNVLKKKRRNDVPSIPENPIPSAPVNPAPTVPETPIQENPVPVNPEPTVPETPVPVNPEPTVPETPIPVNPEPTVPETPVPVNPVPVDPVPVDPVPVNPVPVNPVPVNPVPVVPETPIQENPIPANPIPIAGNSNSDDFFNDFPDDFFPTIPQDNIPSVPDFEWMG